MSVDNSIPPRGRASARNGRGAPASGLHPLSEALDAITHRSAAPDVLSPEFRREHRLRGRVHAAVHIDGTPFVVRPLREHPEAVTHALCLHPPLPDVPLYLFEFEDPEQGSSEPGYEGIGCSCEHYTRDVVCRHIRALAVFGLVRPAPLFDTIEGEDLYEFAPAPSEGEERTW